MYTSLLSNLVVCRPALIASHERPVTIDANNQNKFGTPNAVEWIAMLCISRFRILIHSCAYSYRKSSDNVYRLGKKNLNTLYK